MIEASHKKVIKNTTYLYIRMVVVLLITLYTSRVVLNYLGATDYGIYNLVSGLVFFFSFVSNSMQVSIQRTLSYELGKNGEKNYESVFSSVFFLMLAVIVAIVIILWAIGFSTFASKLTIPPDRLYAAKWVYYIVLFQLLTYAIEIPFSSDLIAREEIKKYSIINIVSVVLKLGVVYALSISGEADKLIFYAILTVSVSYFVQAIYIINYFSHKRSILFKRINKDVIKSVVGYSTWSLIGSLASVGLNQGINIILNVFWGPVLNASRAISFQVQHAINNFASNIRIAVNPQLVKNFAVGKEQQMAELLIFGMKSSSVIILLISVPIFFKAEYVLTLWLKNVPEYTVSMTKLFLISGIIDSVAGTLHTTVQARSDIRNYQLISSTTILLAVPLAWLFLKMGFSPDSTVYSYIIMSVIVVIERCIFIRNMFPNTYGFIKRNILLTLIVLPVLTMMFGGLINYLIPDSFIGLIGLVMLTSLFTITVSWFLLLSLNERSLVINFIQNKIHKSK